MQIGFHTDAFNSAYWNFEQCLEWGRAHGLHYVECGVIDGVSWIHGLGYQPHLALWEDPLAWRRKLDGYGMELSQLDAAFPLSLPEGATLGVEYVLHTLRWAKLAGCPRVDTTDDRRPPRGTTDREALDHMRRIYTQLVEAAERYQIVVNIEPHGYYTTRPETLAEMLSFVESPYLGLNFDTGNTFIAGRDPMEFVERFGGRINHVHVKDVSAGLAAAARGELTGIAVSHCATGEGVNADNIRRSVEMLAGRGYRGVLSIECEGQGGPMIERSLEWVRQMVEAIARGAAAGTAAGERP